MSPSVATLKWQPFWSLHLVRHPQNTPDIEFRSIRTKLKCFAILAQRNQNGGRNIIRAPFLSAASCSPSSKQPIYQFSFNSDNFEIFRHLRATFFKMAAHERKPIGIFLHRILPPLPMNICTKFHQFLQSSFWDIKLFMFRCISAAILKMAAILKILNSRCTTTLGAYGYCEVSLRSVQPSLRSSADKIHWKKKKKKKKKN